MILPEIEAIANEMIEDSMSGWVGNEYKKDYVPELFVSQNCFIQILQDMKRYAGKINKTGRVIDVSGLEEEYGVDINSTIELHTNLGHINIKAYQEI